MERDRREHEQEIVKLTALLSQAQEAKETEVNRRKLLEVYKESQQNMALEKKTVLFL